MKPQFDRELNSGDESPDEADEHQELPVVALTDQQQDDPPPNLQVESSTETTSPPTEKESSQDDSTAISARHQTDVDSQRNLQLDYV
jgi:hypothetical protein